MFLQSLTTFIKKKKNYAEKFASFEIDKEPNKDEYKRILDILCELLMNPKSTEDVAECFPQLLPILICTSISMEKISFDDGDSLHKLNSVILGKLLCKNQDLLIFVLHYFELNPAPFESIEVDYSPSSKRRNKRKIISFIEVSDYDLVTACYDILCSASMHFKYIWNWSKFYKYLIHEDEGVRWIAINCIAVVLGMSESCYLAHANDFLSKIQQFSIESKEINKNNITFEDTKEIDQIFDVPSVVSIGGILLPVFKKSKCKNDLNLVPVPSTRQNLQNLAFAISSNNCVCLQGAVGSGKTALVEFLAHATGHDTQNFAKVQLGDQTDSKMLLGMYRCTDIPGEFLWQPGILTEAVLSGKWLLLEDIDCAASDVLSVIGQLVETKTLSVPGYRDLIHIKSGFQLFVTRRLISGGTQKSLQMPIQKEWSCVNVESLSKKELVTIVQTLFPVLHTVATRIVDVFLLFSVGNHEDEIEMNNMKNSRQISTRDLIKWCSRAIIDFDVSSPSSALKIFQDALDVFCCSMSNSVQRLNLAIAVAHKLGIVKTKAEFFAEIHKPSVNVHEKCLIVGRAKLEIKKSDKVKLESKNSNFSYTRPSVCLLERIASCIIQKEPVLLVGETGTGKTSCVQYLAQITGHKLIVINMNQQSESTDLLGGYKPVDLKLLILPIREEFEILFRSYFAIEPNLKFLNHIGYCFEERKWKTLTTLMIHSTNAALRRLRASMKNQDEVEILKKWEKIAQKLEKLQSQVQSQYSLAFSFVEGSLIKALKNGDWVLLDEINLATAETLECLSGLLEGSCGSLSLLERGDKEPIKRHKDFAIFACMNPATDVGKKDLPVGLRNRFTEFFVDELIEKSDLQLLISSYLNDLNLSSGKIESIVKFYLNVRKEAETTLLDGTGHKPHYSLRTLCRALNVSAQNPCANAVRSLYEAFCLSFLTQLDSNSYPIVLKMIVKAILGDKNASAIIGIPIPRPHGFADNFICFEGYWIPKGDLDPQIPENYILTETVKQNLKDLVRVVSIGKIPVLLQGDTSVGKTSLITYLAKASGHVCVRINNHEHTDLQEYVGTYIADSTGKLVFKEGILVDAMRKGYWIILDELNLAPSDVLEALNRVLDDNRELFIPETQQVVKAHNNFMLFATQNPPGLYGGRKMLSRAFRNRFVELHFDEIPSKELQVILHKRCKMPETYCKQVINVMTELQVRRKSTATFAGKKGFITLRDLFRWAERYHLAPDTGGTLYDWSQHLADEGYLVLSSKVRHPDECLEIIQVLKKHLRRDVDPDALFSLSEKTSTVTKPILESLLSKKIPGFEHLVWTYQMRKMAVLLSKACDFKEPILLIGETGGGKTTVCQLLSVIKQQELSIVNCHMHTEASDFLGSLRPVREHGENQKLFEWVDGPLVKSMKTGGFFLIDEISLADDSVLERLNSLLEPERKLLIAEKPSSEENATVTAHENFIFVGTMNPGGDYGKKELSPALRNRFTEIWCEGCVSMDDLKCIIEHNLHKEFKKSVSTAIIEFIKWLQSMEIGKKLVVSVRDILTWVNFVNCCENLKIGDAFFHGAALSYIDGLGSGLTAAENSTKLKDFKDSALKFIEQQIQSTLKSELILNYKEFDIEYHKDKFGIHPFYVKKGNEQIPSNIQFAFSSPTTKMNTLKVLRALQLRKPILLEGSPGVGKTSLVSALARASGHHLLRLNLSDQTDISDLFGADLPVEGGKPGEFSWKDGPFLRALKNGDWILLDELNLASQSVLEGLNACLDHRGEIYIPELGMTFIVKSGTRLFGCQNPLRQGGARRGLPKSFLNRFTQVFIDALEQSDLKFILNVQFPELSEDLLDKMIQFNEELSSQIGITWGHSGSPWEMNLRDVTRWCEIMMANFKLSKEKIFNPGNGAQLIYINRMRTNEDKKKIIDIYNRIFSQNDWHLPDPEFPIYLTKDKIFLGDEVLDRNDSAIYENNDLLLLREQKIILKGLAQCVNMNWMSILVGGSGTGKSSLVHLLANLTGRKLKSLVVNPAMDTTEILGGFEQTDYDRHLEELLERVETLLIAILRKNLRKENLDQVAHYHALLENVRHLSKDGEGETMETTMSSETKLFLRKTEELSRLVSAMKRLEVHSELLEIEKKLADLSIAVNKDRCLNAGGKFEWVDSVLVKCLRNGTWLLLDQVNLCSPAILDRLNGLLEPNGALTIGEKGVDENGDVFTVTPHKDFRLFLAMDPRHGEISRAMRNRGVEISILTPQNHGPLNRLDVVSLLNNCGIWNWAHRNSILEIHRSLYDNRYRLNEMLQVASFTSRQMSKGFSFERSLRNSCRELCGTFDAGSRHQAWGKIEEILSERNEENGERAHFCYDLDALTLRLRDLRTNSRLAIIKQQGFLLKSAVEKFRDDPEKIDLRDLFDEPPITDTKEFLKHLLLDFYERSSIDDLPIRRLWSSNIFSKNELDELERMNECLAKKVENSKLLFEFGSDVPLYLIERSTLANNLSIKLYFQLMILDHQSGRSRNVADDDEDVIRLEEYSSAVSSGRLSTNLRHETLILKFAEVTEQCRIIVDTILEHGDLPIDDKTYLELRDELKWYKRFRDQGATRLVDRSRGTFFDLREITSSLTVHYKWLIKSFRRLFALLPPSSNHHLSQRLSDFSTQFFHLHKGGDKYRKLRKKIKNRLPSIPPPHLSHERIAFLEKLRSASRKLEMNEEDSIDLSRTRLKIASIRHEQNSTARDRLMGMWIEDWRGNDCCEEEEIHRVDESILELRESGGEESSTSSWREGVELCPVYEFFFLIFAYRFQGRLWDECSRDRLEGDFKRGWKIWEGGALKIFEGVATIPARLIALMTALNEEATLRGKRVPALLHELFNGVEDFTRRSFSAGNSNVFLRCLRENEEEGRDDFQTSLVNKSTLCHLLYELFFPGRGEGATFGNHESRNKLLRAVRALLWRNSSALNSAEYDVSTNDSVLLRFYINHYLSAVNEIVDAIELNPTEEENVDLANRLLSPVNALRGIEQRLRAENDAASRGKGWMLLGCVQLFLFADLGSIDPVRKAALRSAYLGENLAELDRSILIGRLQSAILGETCKRSSIDRSNEARDRFENSAHHPVRPTSRPFSDLREEVENFSSNVASSRSTFERMERLSELATREEEARSREGLHEAEVWGRSLERFSAKLERKFLPGFPDLVSPILSAVSSLRHGLSILTAPNHPPTPSHELLRFPVAGRCQEDYLNLVKLCSSNGLTDAASKMAKIALAELENLSLAARNGGETGSLMDELVRILHGIRVAWKEQEKRREEEARERESLFRSKGGKKQEEEEEEEEEEFRDMFPDHGSADFLDFKERIEGNSRKERRRTAEEEISWRDARIVREIHSSVLLNCSTAEDRGIEPDFLRPLAQRYELLGRGMKTWPEDASSRLLPTLNVLISRGSSSSLRERGETYNFYKNPNVDEVELCRPLLDRLLNRIEELSREWPENPLLNSIRTIIDRVFGFPIESPLSRYLTGVELLLTKVKQWEENARYDVSLAGFVESLGATVLRWRRLEFSRWKDTLQLVEDESRAYASKWWFHLFDLTEEYVASGGGSSKGRIIESLHRFFTESCLIEFEDRLELVRLFYLHHSSLGKRRGQEEEGRRKELLAVLWNVHLYYARFVDHVRGRVKASKEPIAKRLRDTIKIARWEDSSYWSVRNTAEKTRRTLHKFAREYRKCLGESVAAHLVLKTDSSPSPSERRKRRVLEASDFLIDPVPEGDACSIEIGARKLAGLAGKARRYCERVISSHDYSRIRTDVEAFVEECLDESESLREARIGGDEKGRRGRGSRSIAQRKRMALANYFKTLATRLGVSYRVGVLAWKNRRDEVVNLACPPLDLAELILQELFLQGERGGGRGLAEEWHDCDRYYYGSMVKMNFLDGLLNSGRGGLEARDAERCRGLSAHLALLAHRQKETIAKFLDGLLPLCLQVSNLGSMTRVGPSSGVLDPSKVSRILEFSRGMGIPDLVEALRGGGGGGEGGERSARIVEFARTEGVEDIPGLAEVLRGEGIIPAQREFRNAASNFQGLLEVLQISVKQIVVFLESCPIDEGVEEGEGGLDLNEARVPMLRDGGVSRSAAASMKGCLELVRGIASESSRWVSIERRVERSGGGVLLSHRGRVEFLGASYRRIDRVKRELIELGRAFTDDHPIAENVRFLIGKIDESNEVFGSVPRAPSAGRPSGPEDWRREKGYEAKLDALVTQILLVVQKKVQDCRKIGDRLIDEREPEGSVVEENLITERLVESLEKAVPELRLNTVSRMLGELLEIIHESDVVSANHRVRSLLRYLPLLEQYALLLRYYLYEQVACFRLTCKFLYLQLNVFLELAANGFCLPKDEDEAERGEEGKNVEGGMGLAEGEGREDVSERIESEDQMEGARDPNEEGRGEEEGKKEMREEEKGIEMSEDFEGTVQDIEGRRDEEEEEKDEEDDDIDKEMGETDETADKLDEEIWKDEEEEEQVDEDKENEREERGRGEKTGKEELSAKDEGKGKDGDEEKEVEGEREGEEKKEINEFEEPEVNEDQIDPYHGKIRPEIEPEPFELPEDVNLDEEGKEDNPEGEEEEDPFDIDQMKESKISEEMEEETEEKEGSEEDKRKESGDDDDDEEEEEEKEDSNLDGDKRKEEKVEKDEKNEKNLEEEKEDEKNVEEEEDMAPASCDAGSKEVDASQEVESRKDGSRDAVESRSNEEQMEINPTENCMESKKDKGTGQSQTEEREGHSGSKQEENVPTSGEEVSLKQAPKRRRPGQSDEKRSLPDDDARSSAKKLKTAEIHDRDTEEESEKNKGGGESETYEHIKSSEKHDDYAFDAATEEQIKKQASNLEDKEDKMDDQLEDDDVKMHEDPEPNDREEETKKEQSQKLSESKKEKSTNARGERTDDAEQQIEIGGEVEGENVETIRVLRGNESTIHTKLSETELHDVSTDDIARKRSEIENMLGQWSHGPSSIEAANAWNSISAITESAARELSEKLRLVLEPTLTSRLKGDYRTGKRINMRKVIPYIASEFRKDKIWLRRTKPSKRDYQIVLAIDDSSSMADNHSKELAFESLSLIGKAMTYLEVGQLAVVNFGERVNILHPFGENFTEESGARLIQEMKFEQKKTMIGQLLDFTIEMFASQSSSSDNAKLVTILSDGRGIFSEGIETVTTAVRKAKLLNIFLVFIIVDNPLNKDSILDIRMPVFDGGKLLGIRSYMDNFPFPFYIILRDLNSLPVVLSDALRQWFEIVGRIDT